MVDLPPSGFSFESNKSFETLKTSFATLKMGFRALGIRNKFWTLETGFEASPTGF
jgi:hypothetical protein